MNPDIAPFVVAPTVAAVVFAGAMLGLLLHRLLPEHHLTKESQDIIRLGTGMLSVLASLVLGLLIATAKSAFDTGDTDVRNYSANLVQLYTALNAYGPASTPAREALRAYTEEITRYHWRDQDPIRMEDPRAGGLLTRVRDEILSLAPADERQKWLRNEALSIYGSLQQARWLLIQQQGDTIRPLLLWIVTSWIALIFMSFGLNAPRNATIIVAFLLCAVSIGCAMFLVMELDTPFHGLMKISNEPMQSALAHMKP